MVNLTCTSANGHHTILTYLFISLSLSLCIIVDCYHYESSGGSSRNRSHKKSKRVQAHPTDIFIVPVTVVADSSHADFNSKYDIYTMEIASLYETIDEESRKNLDNAYAMMKARHAHCLNERNIQQFHESFSVKGVDPYIVKMDKSTAPHFAANLPFVSVVL
jgi:hypothetical protein